MQQWFLLKNLSLAQHVSGTTMPIIRSSRVLYHRQQPLYNTLELLMIGTVLREKCWASNKIFHKNLCCI